MEPLQTSNANVPENVTLDLMRHQPAFCVDIRVPHIAAHYVVNQLQGFEGGLCCGLQSCMK